jgi:hypothetical protein
MWAVALVASFGQSGTIYWIKEGQCYEINDRVAVPKSEIEGRYLPEQGYELPPQID